jgi:serine/threonine-protein kinase HipA
MNLFPNITICPGTLQPGFGTYSPKCRRLLFNGQKVSHVLPFDRPTGITNANDPATANKLHISISGVQEKYSLRQAGRQLHLAAGGGTHILKPISGNLHQADQLPANEHLTMQLAAQVYKLPTAANALIFFADGSPAYITKRFDVQDSGKRCLKEDFASLAGATVQTMGTDYKYNYSYTGIAELIEKYIPAAIPAKEQLFKMVAFNYLFSNGDAHLKNFARLDCLGDGLASLAPAYDLLNTGLHISDNDMALADGLYDGDHKIPSFASYGFYAYDDFYEFGLRMGLLPNRINRMLLPFTARQEKVYTLLQNSFLTQAAQKQYQAAYEDRRYRFNQSFSGKFLTPTSDFRKN